MKNPEITTLRNDFTVPAIKKNLCHLKTLPLEESETILSNLQCKELANGEAGLFRKEKRETSKITS